MLGKIGDVVIGNGYPANDKDHKIVYPPDRFTEFLKVDATNVESIRAYCQRYKFIPRDLTNGFQDGFIKEQEPIKLIVNHILNATVTNDDLTKVSQEMEGINSLLQFIDKDAITLINDTLSDIEFGEGVYPSLNSNTDEYQVIATKQYPNTIARFYEELSKLILRKRLLKSCRNCGQLFVITKKASTKQFCSDGCRDKYHKKEAYHSKK